MATYSTNEFKSGMKVLLEGDPCSIVENEFVKPGKGQAFNRVRLKNLKTGRVWERTFKSGETLEAADVMEHDMEYVYTDGEYWHFMKTDGSYEQIAADKDAVSDAMQWLKEQGECTVTLWNDVPIQVVAPNFVDLEIVETDPGVRGDTATGGTKPATLTTGAVVKVPCSLILVRPSGSTREQESIKGGVRPSVAACHDPQLGHSQASVANHPHPSGWF